MIYIKDNFLDREFFEQLELYLKSNEWEEKVVGEKEFYIQSSLKDFDEYMENKLSIIEQKDVKNILSFFRKSTDELDNSWRIHSDLNIKGEKPDRALVYYISPREKEDLHGTALWEHVRYGDTIPPTITNDEYDEMIKVDAENLDMWRLSSVIGYKQNRLISYPSAYFHSKYPNKSWKQGREIFVMFYKYI